MTEPKSAADRIAEAPRAWAVKWDDGSMAWPSMGRNSQNCCKEKTATYGGTAVPVAIVELEGE